MRAYYESFGCQMNAFDTEVIESMLGDHGFVSVEDPAEADVIIVNTCSVRENAERRALGRLNDLSRHKEAVLAVCGCMAKRMGESLFEEVPGLSIVLGPDNYNDLPAIIKKVQGGAGREVSRETDPEITYKLHNLKKTRVSRFLSITRGCENFCTYCIVPYLRGPVRSKDSGQIVDEIRMLTDSGAREVTLLGQNVMAYSSAGTGFTGLLERILESTDLPRIRFLTTHPRDLDEGLFRLMRKDGRVCPHLHLPFQSGSNRILGLMGRGYTREKYIDEVGKAREIMPGLALTTDIIVGFPTETRVDFEDTLEIVERAGFDSAFTFKYSPREGTGASEMEDDVSGETKKKRLEELNSLVMDRRRKILDSLVGLEDEILLDGRVIKGENHFWKGRTPQFRNVLLEGGHLKDGMLIPVVLKEIRNYTFVGEEIPRR